MDEISAASQEQAQGVDQVNKAMIQMETVTQQNAANAEESASASEELSAQAENMRTIVRQLLQMVNGKTGTLRAEMENSGHEVNHLTQQSGQTAKAISTARQTSARLDSVHHNTLLTDKTDKKTKVISPEDVIPLEKDPHHF
jgi:methyl-accepting chemotaxis protein